MTNKHLKLQNSGHSADKYECDCGKRYSHRNSLWNHRHTCSVCIGSNADNDTDSDTEKKSGRETAALCSEVGTVMNTIMKCAQSMFVEQMHAQTTTNQAHTEKLTAIFAAQTAVQAAQSTTQMKELIDTITLTPQIINQAVTSTNVNNKTHNYQFNLNIFLNEYCKNAYTLEEVINEIQYSPDDLDMYEARGYRNTIAHKFHESIKDMPLNKRPIHCTDLRRKSICVKVSDDVWEKNADAVKRLEDGLIRIRHGVNGQFMLWREAHPDHYHKHPQNNQRLLDQYHNLCAELGKALELEVPTNIQKVVGAVCEGVVLSAAHRKEAMLVQTQSAALF